MFDVVLIYPPVNYGKGGGAGLPPLGVLYLAAYLNKYDVRTTVIDAAFHSMTIKEIASKIAFHKPKLVGISGLTPHFRSIRLLCDTLRQVMPSSLKICLGGAHFNATFDEAFNYIDADYIIIGEGEETIYQLYKQMDSDDICHIEDLVYKSDGKTITNKRRPLNLFLDDLPFPNLSHLESKTDYHVRYGKYDKATSLMASRGCPFQCSFCDVHTTQGKKLRLRSPQSIVEEIRFNLDKFLIKEFVFKDSTFTINRKWVNTLVDEMVKENLKICWSVNTRVDMIDGDLIERMKQAGCRKISFGVESGDPEILKIIRKGITPDQVRYAFKSLKKHKIESHAFFMIGSPGETPETAEGTIQFAKELDPTWAAFAPTVAYPGTNLYEESIKNGYLKNKYWYIDDVTEVFLSNIGSISKGQLLLPEFPPDRQIETVQKAYKQFYFRFRWLIKLLNSNITLCLLKNIIFTIPTFFRLILKW